MLGLVPLQIIPELALGATARRLALRSFPPCKSGHSPRNSQSLLEALVAESLIKLNALWLKLVAKMLSNGMFLDWR